MVKEFIQYPKWFEEFALECGEYVAIMFFC